MFCYKSKDIRFLCEIKRPQCSWQKHMFLVNVGWELTFNYLCFVFPSVILYKIKLYMLTWHEIKPLLETSVF